MTLGKSLGNFSNTLLRMKKNCQNINTLGNTVLLPLTEGKVLFILLSSQLRRKAKWSALDLLTIIPGLEARCLNGDFLVMPFGETAQSQSIIRFNEIRRVRRTCTPTADTFGLDIDRAPKATSELRPQGRTPPPQGQRGEMRKYS